MHEEQMTEKKKLEDVTEVQMKYQKEIEAIVRGMSSPKVMHDRLLDYHENDIAAALEDMNPTERQRLYRILKRRRSRRFSPTSMRRRFRPIWKRWI